MNPKAIDDMGMAMADVYAAVTDRILINLAHHFPYVQTGQHMGSWEYQTMMLAQMGKVEKETIAIIAQSLGGADEALKQALETAILQGLKNEEPKLRQAAMNGLLKPNGYVPELDPSQLQAFTSYYKQSADKLNLVNTVMLDSTKQAYQATVADVAQKIANTQGILNAAAGEVITGVSAWNGAMHSAVQKMVSNGITGFIDHAGHKWSPEAYVAMDIKTTMFNTARAAVWERSEQYGSDLYQVSSHNAARPLCYPWQGKVISTSGRTGVTHDLDGNEVVIHSESEIESFRYGGGLFGVNCGHYPMTFIPNFSTLKGEPQDQATNDKQYAETQQQRALERRLREEKRDLEVMKAQGAPAEQIKAQRDKVRSASADIDEFCDKTGLPRRRNREADPVRAEWSTPTGNITRYNGDYIATFTDAPQNPPALQVPVLADKTKNTGNYTPELQSAISDSVGTQNPKVIDLINRTSNGCEIDWVDGEGTCHYSRGSGHITMYKQKYGEEIPADELAATRWHEYFHYVDDANVSNSGFQVQHGDYTFHGIYEVAQEGKRYQNAIADDINDFFKANGLSDKYVCRYADDNSTQWIYKNGLSINPRNLDLETSTELHDALNKWFKEQSGYNAAVNYPYTMGYPADVKWDDYYETYVTPKLQKVRIRPRYNGADIDYAKAVEEVAHEKEVFAQTHDVTAMFAEQSKMFREAEKAQEFLGYATDTFDGGAYGAFTSVIFGGHDPVYYATNDNGVKEAVANVGAAIVTENETIVKGMKSLCPKTYQLLADIITGQSP